MVALVHDEGVSWDRLRVDFVGIQEVNELGLGSGSLL